MKIRQVLQHDFVDDLLMLYNYEELGVLNEDIDQTLFYCRELRPGDSFSFYVLPLYVITRLVKPSLVIETGVQNGASTQAILYGLHQNKKGRLVSIDSGGMSTDGSHVQTIAQPGEKVWSQLKDRWELNIGLSKDILKSVLREVDKVDLFFHDSDHSQECVEEELKLVRSKCKPGSLVGMHDYYNQFNPAILQHFEMVVGSTRPPIHEKDGQFHNVLRLWKCMYDIVE